MTTKAQLEAQVTELQERLDAALAATPDAAPRLPGFADRIYLPKDVDEVVTNKDGSTWKPVKYGTTKNGSRYIEFKAQVAHKDKETGKRTYSRTRIPLKAWNDQCDQIMSLIQDDNRLVEITANFLPDTWVYEGKDYSTDFWYVVSVDPIERPAAEEQGELNV